MLSLFGENLFDDWMGFPMRELANVDKRLYGKNASHVMKTDVNETDGNYELEIDLPGFKKDEIKLTLENGYLTVSAAKSLDKDKKNIKGRIIRQERYAGSMQRSFYVGEEVAETDIKAKFEDGVLKLSIPKKEAEKVETAKTIAIEG